MNTEIVSRLIKEHTKRTNLYATVFEKVAKDADKDQKEAFYKTASAGNEHRIGGQDINSHIEHRKTEDNIFDTQIVTKLVGERNYESSTHNATLILPESTFAQASTFQPIRDIVLDGFIILSEDKKLDIIGAPYPEIWTSESGNTLRGMQNVWADRNGTFGFDHNVRGTVSGMQSNCGAGMYIRFIPPIATGVAQIRPYLPFSYKWSTLSFKSREDSSGGFGIRVWSWNLNGGDVMLEQDYKYSLWKMTSIASLFATDSNPSWYDIPEDGIPGLDFDNAFSFGTQPPYFKTRPDRIYMAAVSCFGLCWSVSPENRPGASIGRIDAKMPWVVVGYQ